MNLENTNNSFHLDTWERDYQLHRGYFLLFVLWTKEKKKKKMAYIVICLVLLAAVHTCMSLNDS